MALQFIAKKLIYTLKHPFILKQPSISFHRFLSPIFPPRIRNIHLSSSLLKELVRFNLADIGEGIREVTIKEWYIKVGDRVSQFDNICEVQSDKAAVTITSRYDGVVKKIYHELDETALVGKPLIDIELDRAMEDDQVVNETVEEAIDSDYHFGVVHQKVSTTPSVRRLAKENNVNLTEVTATGPHDRILKEDVINFIKLKSLTTEKVQKPHTEPEHPKKSIHSPPKIAAANISNVIMKAHDVVVPIKGLMKAMFKTMTVANSIPDFSFCDEINMNHMMDMKYRIKSLYKEGKITFMPFFIKAASIALLQYPQLNAHLDVAGENLIHKASHNIGFALDTPDGLIVPKIYSVQTKSIIEIAKEMDHIIEKGKMGKLSLNELTDGTFTISNIGNIGGTYTRPIILAPEVVIGGIGRIQKVPRYDYRGEVVPTSVMQISWCADHRVVDGATMAKFSNLWKKFLECPEMLMLHLR